MYAFLNERNVQATATFPLEKSGGRSDEWRMNANSSRVPRRIEIQDANRGFLINSDLSLPRVFSEF